RRFLPADEGGADPGQRFALRNLRGFTAPNDPAEVKMTRKQLFDLALVPWEALPALFRDPRRFPYNIGLGQQVRGEFGVPFTRLMAEAGWPRDLMLRGRYDLAVRKLVSEEEPLRDLERQRVDPVALQKQIGEWVAQATAVYAEQQRARGDPQAQ